MHQRDICVAALSFKRPPFPSQQVTPLILMELFQHLTEFYMTLLDRDLGKYLRDIRELRVDVLGCERQSQQQQQQQQQGRIDAGVNCNCYCPRNSTYNSSTTWRSFSSLSRRAARIWKVLLWVICELPQSSVTAPRTLCRSNLTVAIQRHTIIRYSGQLLECRQTAGAQSFDMDLIC